MKLMFNGKHSARQNLGGLRARTLVVTGLALAALIVVLYIVSQLIVVSAFLRLEQTHTADNVNRVTNAITEEISALDGFTGDYSDWDDTDSFIRNSNDAYIRSNLDNTTFINAKLDAFAFVDTKGKLVWGHGYDADAGEQTALPKGLLAHIKLGDKLLQHDNNAKIDGIVVLPEGAMMIVSRPILNSQSGGPVLGSVISGRYINEAKAKDLGERTNLSVQIQELGERTLPVDFQTASKHISKSGQPYVSPLTSSKVAGYEQMDDIYSQAALLVRIDEPRTIVDQGNTTTRFFIVVVALVGLVFIMLVLVLLERQVLSPVVLLSSELATIGHSRDLHKRVKSRGPDELGQLAHDINTMLGKLDQSNAELLAEKSSVEGKITTRTAQLVKALTEVQELYEHEQEVEQLKDMFVTIASHELRTPLTILRGQLDYLKSAKLPADLVEPMKAIAEATGRFGRLSEELINLASIEKGELKPRFSATDVGELVRQICADNLDRAKRKGLKLASQLPAKLPPAVFDGSLIAHALTSLTDNAIKYTPEGSVTISAAWHERELWLSVADTGLGIAPEQQSKLFRKFGKLQAEGEGFESGHGLGLYLVKLIAEAHKGTVSVESTAKGSTFTIKLPLDLKPAE